MNLRTGICLTLIAIACAWYVSIKPMDFRVYYYGARGVFDGSRPVYGPSSGLGWPMHYRYPPVFLLLFAPLTLLPLGLAAACWVIAKLVVLVLLLQAMARKFGTTRWLIPLLLAGAYVVQDFRYGNAQFFVFALTAFSLLFAREKPGLSAAALALGIATKVWPAFFLPYFLIRKDWKLAGQTVLITLALTVLPSVYFGFRNNVSLLGEWAKQEFATQTGQEEIWFPSQSLRGVMMRYLSVVDYSKVPDSNYPLVNIAAWDPKLVRTVWFVTAGGIYALFLAIAYRGRESERWVEQGLAFCLIGLLEPFTQKYALVILLWPAMVLSRYSSRPGVRLFVYLAIGLVLIQPAAPGAAAQRLLQVLGLDFAATLAIAVALAAGYFFETPHLNSRTV